HEGARPLVVPERPERRLAPAGGGRGLVADGTAERLVGVPEDARRDVDAGALGALDGIAAAVDLRRDGLNLDARRRLLGLRQRHEARSFDDLRLRNRIPCGAVRLP